MRDRKTIIVELLLLGGMSLLFGGVIYIIFRENVYISNIFEKFFNIEPLRKDLKIFKNEFFCFYLVDFLWAFSLSCFLHAIFLPEKKFSICISGAVFGFGALYELLQKINIISGTFDFIDVFLYLSAVFAVSFIYLKRRNVYEKNN